MLRLILAGSIALLLNSAYLVAAPSASLAYYLHVGLHPLLGLSLALALVPRRFRREWATRPLAANGHVADDVERVQSRVTYAQRPQLFRNFGQGDFEEIVASDRSALQTPMVGRGAAYADADNGGDLDVLVTANGGPAQLLRNDGGNANHVLRVRTIGTASNRDGIGARVEVRAGGDTRWQTVKTGSSYLSQSELTLTFGLGPAATLSTVRVAWPSGQVDTVDDVDADQTITIEEGAGLVAAMPIVVRR